MCGMMNLLFVLNLMILIDVNNRVNWFTSRFLCRIAGDQQAAVSSWTVGGTTGNNNL